MKAARYEGLDAGKAGTLFLTEIVDVPRFGQPNPATVSKFDFTTRKTEPFLSGIRAFAVSANGEKVLYRQGEGWFIAGTDRKSTHLNSSYGYILYSRFCLETDTVY